MTEGGAENYCFLFDPHSIFRSDMRYIKQNFFFLKKDSRNFVQISRDQAKDYVLLVTMNF